MKSTLCFHGQVTVTHQSLTDQSWDLIVEQPSGGVCIATCGRAEDKDSLTAANANRLALCWNTHDQLLEACKRALPWIGKMIADGNHLNAVAPNDAVSTMDRLQAAINAATQNPHSATKE